MLTRIIANTIRAICGFQNIESFPAYGTASCRLNAVKGSKIADAAYGQGAFWNKVYICLDLMRMEAYSGRQKRHIAPEGQAEFGLKFVGKY
ncbi:MAG: hypothetical protein LBE17_07810 [Treponema sp.]|jgi:hypothetical protein|nr:hypothetical protein [Treponema sp.]